MIVDVVWPSSMVIKAWAKLVQVEGGSIGDQWSAFIEWWGLSDEIFGAGEMLQLPDSPPQRHWEYRLVIW